MKAAMQRPILVFTTALALCVAACSPKKSDPSESGAEGGDEPKSTAASDDSEQAEQAEPAQRSPEVSPQTLLNYLDPEAVAVLYSRLETRLDPSALGAVYAIPPKQRHVLDAAFSLDEALDVRFGEDGHEDLFGHQIMGMEPAISSAPYLVVPLLGTQAELREALSDRPLTEDEVEGVTILSSDGAFPYKVAILEGAVAFIPLKEIGSGVSPITAGRDLPASQVRQDLELALSENPDLSLVALAAGPMLHLDMDADVGLSKLTLIETPEGGLDGEARYQIAADPTKVDDEAKAGADDLRDREAEFETDVVRAMVERAAITATAGVIEVRLELTRADLNALERK